jgi:hypothetical protein
MYKPNGEEPMTKQEETRRREAIALRARKEPKQESMRSAFYSALFGAASPSDENAGVAYNQAQ